MSQKIKTQLYEACKQFLADRLNTLKARQKSIQESLQSETKSTAGDKHETGRAMLQLEREKTGNQLAALQQQLELLQKVVLEETSEFVRMGSLVETNHGLFFIAISKGLITLNQQNYFAIAPNAPIGKLLLGKQVGSSFDFNAKNYIIKEVY